MAPTRTPRTTSIATSTRRQFLASAAAGAGVLLATCSGSGEPPAPAPVTERIDTHHHFWKYNQAEYGWMSKDMAAIRRDFLPADLEAEIHLAGVTGVVSVQARQSLQETSELLGYAGRHPFILGVVGWVPLTDPKVPADLERLSQNPKLKGIRHVLHDETDERYMLREDFNRGVAVLRHYHLAYDILIFERHLPQTVEFVDRHPEQIFVVDHLAKPRVKDNELSPWKENLARLAERPNVHCKISGLATEADWKNWTPEQLTPYMEATLEAFGPRRVMFGSDWPVCLLAIDYQRWVAIAAAFADRLSETEQRQFWSENARRVYRL